MRLEPSSDAALGGSVHEEPSPTLLRAGGAPIRLPPAPCRVLLATAATREVVLQDPAGAVLADVEERAAPADAQQRAADARLWESGAHGGGDCTTAA